MSAVEVEERADQATAKAAKEPLFQKLYEFTEEEKADILTEFVNQYKDSHDFMRTLWPQMKANYQKYRSIAEPLKDQITGAQIKGRANLFIPYPWAIVETEMPRMAGRLPRLHAFPRREANREKVELIQNNLYYTFDRMDYIQKQILWLRQFMIYGWSPMYCYWREETRTVLEREENDIGALVLKKTQKKVWDDFYCDVLDVWDCFMQPGVEEITQGDYFIPRFWMSKKDILARVEAGLYYPEVKQWLEENPTGGGVNNAEGRQFRDELVGIQKQFLKSNYGNHEVTYRLEDDRLTIMIDRAVLAAVGDNPNPLQTKPIVNVNLTQMISEPIGISTIEALAGLPDKLNTDANQSMDNRSITQNKMFKVRRHRNIDISSITAAPGNIIEVDNMDDIDEFKMTDISTAAERDALTTKEEMQFTMGISDFLVGTKSAARFSDTATGVSTIVREANARFSLKLSQFEALSLRKLVEFAHAYCMMFQSKEKQIHIHGPSGWKMFNVRIQDILYECEFSIEPGSSAPLDQLARRDYMINLLPTVTRMPQIVHQRKFMREVLEAGDIRNPEDLLMPEPETLEPFEDIGLIEGENTALRQGQTIELKGDDALHLKGHSAYTKTPEYASADPSIKELFQAHLMAHFERWQQQQQQAQIAGQNQMFGGMNGAATGDPQAAAPNPGAGGVPTVGPVQESGMGGVPGLFGG